MKKIKVVDVIEKAGGRRSLSNRLGLDYYSVVYWEKVGYIPRKYWGRIAVITGIPVATLALLKK